MGGVIMLQKNRQDEIIEKATLVNRASEKYQLIHATFAIEKMFKDKLQVYYANEFEKIRKQLMKETEEEKKRLLYQKIRDLKNESNKKIKIIVDYMPQIKENSARTTKTQNNTFMISLPKSLENIRNDNGEIDFNKLKKLRHLMAHELGHIVLHSGIMGFDEKKEEIAPEEEADFFAEKLIELRRLRNKEIHENDNYEKI